MVIEWLVFDIAPELREAFIQADEAIWSTALAKAPGYLGKEVWLDAQSPRQVVMVIRWASQQAWDAVSTDALEKTEAHFADRMGTTYTLLESRTFQQRKFPAPIEATP